MPSRVLNILLITSDVVASDRELSLRLRVWGVGEEDIPTPHRVQAPDFSRGD